MTSSRFSPVPGWCWVLLLTVLVLVVYSPSGANEFVWDDHFFVEGNAAVQGKAPLSSLWLKPVKFERAILPLWRPLPLTVYAALRSVFGTSAAAFHRASVLLHAAVALLLFLWFVEMRISRPVAFAASALYAVHPFLTSAVTYVAGMADPLAAFFSLTALLLWQRAFRSVGDAPQGKLWQKGLLAGCLAWLCALFCKEWALLVPALAAISFAGGGRKRSAGESLFWKAGFWTCLFIAGIYVCFRSEVFAKSECISSIRMDFLERIACAVMSSGFYQLGGLFPVNLRMDRYYHLAKPEFWWWFMAGASLLFGWFFAVRQFKDAWFKSGAWRGFAWFWIFWLFHSNLPFVLNAHVAEHWMYFAYMGLAWAGADLWTSCAPSLRPRARGIVGMTLVLFGLFWAGRTFARQLDWQDDFVFFQRNIAAGADTTRSHLSLGSAYAREGDFANAAAQFSKVLEKDPGHFQAAVALARCHFFMGDYAKAAAIVRQMRARHPADPVLGWFEADCIKALQAKKAKSH